MYEDFENEDSKKTMIVDNSGDKYKDDSSGKKVDNSIQSNSFKPQMMMIKNEKLSKTLSKNQMKLKMAAKIKEHKPDSSDQDVNSLDQLQDKSREILVG